MIKLKKAKSSTKERLTKTLKKYKNIYIDSTSNFKAKRKSLPFVNTFKNVLFNSTKVSKDAMFLIC